MFSDLPLRRLAALLSGVALLVLGNGLYGTLLTLRAESEGFGASLIGAMTSAFFAGYIAASVLSPALIERVGLVRSFAVLASVVSVAALLVALVVDEVFWLTVRILHGASYAGTIIVAESWLNAVADKGNRGQILGLYGCIFLGAWSLSQFPISFFPATGFELFSLVSILFSTSLIPLLLSRGDASPDVSASRMPIRRLLIFSPVGSVGCFLTGAAMNSFFGLAPLYIRATGFSDTGVAGYMSAFFVGGFVAQWPFGLLSDKIDRRLVIALLSGATAGLCLMVALLSRPAVGILLVSGFALGALSIPIYSICVAQANDRVDRQQVVGAMSSLLMIYAAGALVGPMFAGVGVDLWGPRSLFALIGLINVGILLFVVFRMFFSPAVLDGEKGSFAMATTTTHMASDLDPRGKRTERNGSSDAQDLAEGEE